MANNQDKQDLQYEGTTRNVTGREWPQMNALLRLLNACNRLTIRATEEVALLQEICRMMVDLGEYSAAWIELAAQVGAQSVPVVAQAGEMPPPLADSAIALDIEVNAHSLGTLHLCSTQTNAFHSDAVEILREVASNLAYGLTALRTRREHQNTEVALRASEAKFRAFLEMASEAVIISNSWGEIVIFNRKAEELFGYSAAEILGQPIESLMPERFRQGHLRFRSEYALHPTPRSMGLARNLYALRRDGTEFPIEAGLSSIQVDDERFVLTFLIDISDRQRMEAARAAAEAQLRESEDHLRYMVELNPQVPWTADPSGRITDFNERWLKLTGLTREQAMGEGWATVPHPEDLPAMVAAWTHSIATGVPYDIEHRIKLADGSYRWMRSRAFPRYEEQGPIVGWYGTTEDIHDTKQAEDQLRESEQRFREMADNAPVMIWVTDATGNCSYLSQSWYEFTGQTANSGLGLGWVDAVHPDDRVLAEANFLQANEQQEGFRIEYRLRRQDGQYRWVIDTATPWLGVTGQFKGYIGSVIDITDRKQAEQALQESEARLKLANTVTGSGLWDWDVSQNNAHVTEEYCALFGISPPQPTLSYEQWLSLLHPNDQDSAGAAISRMIELRQTDYADEYRVLLPNGVRWLAVRGQMFYDAAGNPIRMLGHMQDITLRKEAEIALSQLNEDLEQRVRDRTAELSQLNVRLHQELQKRVQIQQRLAEQAQLLDLAHDPIITCDPVGVITFWNQGAERMYGWTSAEALGQRSHILLQTQFPCQLSNIYAELLRRHYWEGELVHHRRDGTPITVASRWVLQCDEHNQPLKILEINNDITSSKRVEEVQSRLAAIIESSDDAIVSTTLDSIIDSWNWGAEKLYGYTSLEIIGRPATVLLPLDRQHEEAQIVQRLHQGERVEHYETIRQHKDGRLINVSLTASPLKNAAGEIIGISKIARDITRRKQAEAQLQLSNERISLANAELARASRLKDEFLAGMSHELRTPLNAILGLSEALLEEIFGTLTKEQQDQLKTIEQSGKHLLELINDILDLSKVESGKMELDIRPVDISELCHSSINFIRQQAHHKRIKIRTSIDHDLAEVELDERRIRQVLVNLLSNAVKFTPEGGAVELQVRADAFRETIEFHVTDTGIGIAPDNIDKLFQPFVQLDSSLSRRYAGTGLGLALVRRITELHGGSVALESQEGKGSRFSVTLPWQTSLPNGTPALAATTVAGEQFSLRHALIVEDSPAAANQVARYLHELGAETTVHAIAAGAMQVAAQLQPDVIILDILLPDHSGWDVLAQLKSNPDTTLIPVVVISVVDERSRALTFGAIAYLLKPISRPQFQQTLNQVLSQRSAAPQPTLGEQAIVPDLPMPVILLAEDNEANIATVNSYLQAHGFRVILARNGLEAIQMAKYHRPDLILMDIQMPEMNGLEATQQIHDHPDLQHIPIIALTALVMPGDRERCLQAGAIAYLTKPVSLKHLRHLLSQYIP